MIVNQETRVKPYRPKKKKLVPTKNPHPALPLQFVVSVLYAALYRKGPFLPCVHPCLYTKNQWRRWIFTPNSAHRSIHSKIKLFVESHFIQTVGYLSPGCRDGVDTPLPGVAAGPSGSGRALLPARGSVQPTRYSPFLTPALHVTASFKPSHVYIY